MEAHREGGSVAAQRVMVDDARVLASVLRRLLRGEVPSPTRIGLGISLTPAEVEAALTRLHTAGAVYMADGMVRACRESPPGTGSASGGRRPVPTAPSTRWRCP